MSINEISSINAAVKPVHVNQKSSPGQSKTTPHGNQNVQDLVQTIDTETIKHVVMLYDQNGKVCIKFMDHCNNVIYQVPTEMIVKMVELARPEASSKNNG